MNIEVRHIGVFRLLLTLVRFVDQDVEPIRLKIPCEDALKLLFVQPHQLLDGFPESLEQRPSDIAITSRTSSDSKKLWFGLA